MKDDGGLTFVLAALFHAARLSRLPANDCDVELAFDLAKGFIASAKAQGIQPPSGD